ncbi:hypothetical protein PR003_g5651 [Phytophthora rubi]|uniref:Uncharacterized protein n=1 Tax=Phytophthora rubi TaxID=129364 RepID=A0A6A3NR14_9STRA|nr:hypothetical protein PR002_g3332 [Phytophthora rubi]KAE9047869.1 hypothetical protein PR001_g4037 [Phytophthora rubi]KAE9349848.1 hypothetical protein PR003_g5651 [Phytophthora rubi]
MDRCFQDSASPTPNDDNEDDVSLSLPLTQQVADVDVSADLPLSHHDVAEPLRKNFTATDDLILLRAVNMAKPWEAVKGTANGIMKCFDKIADICRDVDGFVQDKPGTALRTRFDKLIRQHRDAEGVSRRASGTVEEYNERDVLLQDIATRMNDWKERQESEKQVQRAKSDGIEASGALMRRLAMGEIEDELPGGGGSADEKAHNGANDNAMTNQKRANNTNSGRPAKVTKTERVAAVTDAIALAIGEMNKGNPEKYAYLNSRLQFEKEEAERKREHEVRMEAQRQRAERARDERLLAAEHARERFMLQLLEIAVGKGKESNQ